MSALHTRLCEMLGVEHPIVQTGMGFVSTARLTAATSSAGAFGILGGVTMDLDELRQAVKDVKARTDKPFGVNVRADQPDIADRIAMCAREGVRVISFAMAPTRDLVARAHDAGLLVIPSIGAKRHAEKVQEMGVDAVLVQGAEGGGHTGSVATTLLLPQVVDTIGIPVIAAGGFFDGRGLVAALAYGASGIAMGTRFLLTSDSEVPDVIKKVYLSKTVNDTLVTTKVDGVPQRVLRTDFVEALERSGATTSLIRALRNARAYQHETGTRTTAMLREGAAMRKRMDLSWAQVVMAANTPMFLRAAMVDGDTRFGVMASGQVVGVIDDLPTCADLIARIVEQADEVLRGLR